jgi:hypothetical protein
MSLDLITRRQLICELKDSIKQKYGFGVGKIGFSEQCMLGYLPFLSSNVNQLQIKAYESVLRYHCEVQFGVFPTKTEFLQKFANFYCNHVLQVDVLGIFQANQEMDIIKKNKLQSKLIPYQQTEPDRSIPYIAENCYLPYFRGKNILFISPFAELLKSRCTMDIFERVWSRIDKTWFFPKNINGIEIPYSIKNSKKTIKDYVDSISLYDYVCSQISKQEFDIALIGAGALSLPIVSYVKSLGKIGISLGGHLQVLFGVKGARWANDEYWKNNYFNEHWIDMPDKYHPIDKNNFSDRGAYW